MIEQTPGECFDLVIIGGGPAGMAAALEARRAGVRSICVLDEGRALGGQIYRRFAPAFRVVDAHRVGHEFLEGQELIEAVGRTGVEVRAGTMVWGVWDKRIAWVQEEAMTSGVIDARVIVLATGARDRPVAFPGWTLPGVMTAGAAKALVGVGRVLPGRRVLMAGSGPLALAFSAQLRGYGVNVVEVVEAAPAPGLRTLTGLARTIDRGTLIEAVRYRLALLRHRIALCTSTIIIRAEGTSSVERAVVAKVDREWRPIKGTERAIEVDTILLGYGLEASSELSRLMGCRQRYEQDLGGWIPVRDELMRTSIAGVLSVGDGSGVAGSRNALVEGRVAGNAAAQELGLLAQVQVDERTRADRDALRRMARFRNALGRIYRVGPGLHELATEATTVCRCEEVTAGEIEALIGSGVRETHEVRALSRAGMGRCQGRNCASHLAAQLARATGRSVDQVAPLSVRPPIKPVPIAAIAARRAQHEAEIELR